MRRCSDSSLEGPLAVDYSDGCARARLRWLMVLADAANSKAVVEFKAV